MPEKTQEEGVDFSNFQEKFRAQHPDLDPTLQKKFTKPKRSVRKLTIILGFFIIFTALALYWFLLQPKANNSSIKDQPLPGAEFKLKN